MITRSHKNVDYHRDSDSEDSVYERLPKKRKHKGLSLSRRQLDVGYSRGSLNLDVQLRYSTRNQMPGKMGRDRQVNENHDKKSDTLNPSPSSSNQAYANGDVSMDDKKNVRRSTRQRKFTYDNLNQTWLLAPSFPEYSKLESLFTSNSQGSPRDEDEEERYPLRRSRRNLSGHDLNRLATNSDSLEFDDMYSRVKRERRKVVHDFYSQQIPQDGGCMADTEDTDQNGLSELDMDDHSDLDGAIRNSVPVVDGTTNSTKYSLRPKKPITERFQFPIEPVRPKRSSQSNMFDNSRLHGRPGDRDRDAFKSAAHIRSIFRRKRHAFHHSSSSSCSSDDERRFEKRKSRSMARARNRCLPINLNEDDLKNGVIRDRIKIGSSLADIDPMNLDKTVTFDSVGGLDKHIQSLKEIVLFPLLYPEVFQQFKISPPRGVLFHGPPGTGKTLVARALANECSTNERHVSFFMRKGADCLSKWVGESERQLRLLFDQAYSMRPSIIFFDEIDGLAPVRSTRQDQIHSSIVSTLLALMDGMDNRGEIIIIGATNRIDAIDPALRRPGRFDREMLFPLPSAQARDQILKIHMQQWNLSQSESLISHLAVHTVGYCGADLKALCTETALVALRRRYPQIYKSRQKLQLDVTSIKVSSKDFFRAMKKMKPSVHRTSVFSAKPLPQHLRPLLDGMLQKATNQLCSVFPLGPNQQNSFNVTSSLQTVPSVEELSSDDSDSEGQVPKPLNGPNSVSLDSSAISSQSLRHTLWPFVYEPRFLLCGEKGQGQATLAPALLHLFEHVPVHRLDVPALYAVTSTTPEEACAQIFHEAQRSLPSILFLPHVGYWWETLSNTVRATFLSLLQEIQPCMPLLLLATSDCVYNRLPQEIRKLFQPQDQVITMENPSEECRRKFFLQLLQEVMIAPKRIALENEVEVLPVVEAPVSRELTNDELDRLRQREEATLRELRLFLRDILNKLARDTRFRIFSRPVDPSEVPDYQEVIQDPMDLETMMCKIDLYHYETVAQFLDDIDLVCKNALEYNPDNDPSGKLIRNRACMLKDVTHAMVLSELDIEFEKICVDIQKARRERGEKLPSPIKQTLPKPTATQYDATNFNEDLGTKDSTLDSLPNTYPTRYSKRIRGLNALANCDDNKKENLPVPRRAVRYMIWRKRKSPWFGGCRRKIIRQKTYSLEGQKKFVQRPTALPSVLPRSLSPNKDNIPLSLNTGPKSAANSANNSPIKEQAKSSLSAHKEASEDNAMDVSEISSPTKSSKEAVGKENKSSTTTTTTTSACDGLRYCDIFVDNGHSSSQSSLSMREKNADPLSGIQHTLEALVAKKESNIAKALSPTIEKSTAREEVQVDLIRLRRLFDQIARKTEDCTVEMLQQFFLEIQQCIYLHRKECNKDNLLCELEKIWLE